MSKESKTSGSEYPVPAILWWIVGIDVGVLVMVIGAYFFNFHSAKWANTFDDWFHFFDFVTKPMTFVVGASAVIFTFVNYLRNRKKYENEFSKARIDQEISTSLRMLETLIPRFEDANRNYQEKLELVIRLYDQKKKKQADLEGYSRSPLPHDLLPFKKQADDLEKRYKEEITSLHLKQAKVERIQTLAYDLINRLKVISPESEKVYEYYNDIFEKTDFLDEHRIANLKERRPLGQ